MREVVTGQREGRPVRYAQIVASYRNARGKPRHRVVLSLGRVDRLDREQLRELSRALVRYLGDEESLLRPRVGEVRQLGLPWAVHAAWERLSLPAHLAHEGRRHGLAERQVRSLFGRVLASVACGGDPEAGRRWLRSEAYPVRPDGERLAMDLDGEELLAQAGPELERGLFLRHSIPDGRVFAVVLPDAGAAVRGAVACDGDGYPLASGVAPTLSTLGPRFHRRLREMGAREVVWGPTERARGAEQPRGDPPAAVLRTAERVAHALPPAPLACPGGLDGARTRLTAALLAALVISRLEADTELPLEALREQLAAVRAAELRDGQHRVRWESTLPSVTAQRALAALGLGDLPRVLPCPGP